MAAMVHYVGVVFYALFASGELQPWAESKSLEDKQWNPYDAAFDGEIKKSSSVQSNGLLQRRLSGKNVNYGTVEPPAPPIVSAGNPFVQSTNPFRQEAVQPEPHDSYMHGTVDDREY
ncbi:vesicular glutamate transporter 1-like [Photinus pyralis]|nr:vesicular glutamate transporter 1-like [Photinus pyralis]